MCATLPPHSLRQNQAGPPLQPSPCPALREIQEYQQNQGSAALNRLLGGDSGRSRECAKSACCAAGTAGEGGHVRPFAAGCGIAGKGWHVAVFLPALCGVSSHPARVQPPASLSPRVCMLWDSSALSCSTVIQYNRESFLLRQQSVQSYQKDPKQKPP